MGLCRGQGNTETWSLLILFLQPKLSTHDCAFGVIIEKTRGAEDDLNTVAAGTMTGMLYKCTGGLRGAARGGLSGLTLISLYALYNNWEHMKGSVLQQSL